MQYSSQDYGRVDGALDKAFVYRIGNNTFFVDKDYNVLSDLDDYNGLKEIYENSFLKTLSKNYIQVYDMGKLDYLENLMLSLIEVDYCNSNGGLHIFLTEQILHLSDEKQNILLDGKNTIDPDVNNESYDNMWSPELDSIQKFIKNNMLLDVKVFVSFEDPKKVYKNKYNFEIIRQDATLNGLTQLYKNVENNFIGASIDTRFWCGNWRYTPHRHLITSFVSQLNTEYSWYYTDYEHNLLTNIWFDINTFKYKHEIIEGLYYLNENCKGIDIQAETMEIGGDIFDQFMRPAEGELAGPQFKEYTNKDLYKNTFCSIVNYGSFNEPFPSYDEKVLNTIINLRPFIFCGPPGSLELMRKDGFKTFGDFWDESYDKEWDHTKRLEKIFDLILEINSWSIEKCQFVYVNMLETIFHNYNLLKDAHIQTYNVFKDDNI